MVKSLRFGRGQNNDVVINDPAVSEFHCQITLDDNGRYYITDLNSTYGTYVNGTLVQDSIWLNLGDLVRIGNTTLPWNDYFTDSKPPQTYQPPQPSQPYPQSYQQPQPQHYPQPTPVQMVPRGRAKNGMGTAGFVLSLLALLLCWVPIVDVILFILGLVFSIVGISRKNREKGLAIAGLVISIVIFFIFIMALAFVGDEMGVDPGDIFDF